MLKNFEFPPGLEQFLTGEDAKSPIWIVGGAIRDYLSSRTTEDIDFVTAGDAIALAREVADRIGADVYILDQDRRAARVLYAREDRWRTRYDFAQMRGEGIEADLRIRDFSVNALAIRISAPGQLLDPCGGLQDLRDGLLEQCTENAIVSDPIRALRAVRIATDFGFRLSPGLLEALRDKPDLGSVSRERIRDEIFKIFGLDEPATALRLLQEFGYLSQVFNPSHSQSMVLDSGFSNLKLIEKALGNVKTLRIITRLISRSADMERAAQATLGLLIWKLGRYRTQFESYLNEELGFDRHRGALMLLVSFLYQVVSPPFEDDQTDGMDLPVLPDRSSTFSRMAGDLRLSREEASFMDRMAGGVDSLLHGVDPSVPPDLFSHRFYRKCADSGVAAVLAMLAHELSNQVEPPEMEVWSDRIETARLLLDAWFEDYGRVVQPEPLINGEEVMQALKLEPGPEVGELMTQVVESQVVGAITTKDEALQFIKRSHEA